MKIFGPLHNLCLIHIKRCFGGGLALDRISSHEILCDFTVFVPNSGRKFQTLCIQGTPPGLSAVTLLSAYKWNWYTPQKSSSSEESHFWTGKVISPGTVMYSSTGICGVFECCIPLKAALLLCDQLPVSPQSGHLSAAAFWGEGKADALWIYQHTCMK